MNRMEALAEWVKREGKPETDPELPDDSLPEDAEEEAKLYFIYDEINHQVLTHKHLLKPSLVIQMNLFRSQHRLQGQWVQYAPSQTLFGGSD